MKTRWICLFLCTIMLLSAVLTGCTTKTDDELKSNLSDTASASAMTLTMWVVVEEAVTDEVAAAVTKELNSISKSKFKTELVVKFLTQDQYQATLTDTILKYENTPVFTGTTATTASGSETGAVTDETRVNDYGFVEIVYPGTVENQVDIIYIAGKEMFDTYVDNGWLASLDSELSGSSKKISEFVANALLSASQKDGVTYAIPNNNVIGEYTYMLLDRELMEKYCQQGYYNRGLIDGFCNEYVYNFIDQIEKFEDSSEIVPIDSTYEECLDMLAHYWSIDPDTYEMLDGFSAFGYYYTDLAELSRGSVVLGYQSLFDNEEFAEDFLALNRFRLNGSYHSNATEEGKRAAVKFVKGDKNSIKKYTDDYYAVAVSYPTASVDDIYSNMFGVYSRSQSISRSMEIVTYLNTNAEFRNVLLYGVEGVHYSLVEEDDRVYIERDKYNRYIMDIDKTGNAFLAYLQPDMSADIWETGKEQNRDALVEPLLGFDFSEYSAIAGVSEDKLTIPKKGYNLSYTTGYSKDVFSQNATLAAWIADCDAKGAGLYVLRTSEVSGSNILYNFYFYNTMGNGYRFVVTEDPVMQTVSDKKGNLSEKQVGVTLTGVYTKNSGSSTSYELSMASVYTKKSYTFDQFCFTVDGTAVDAVVTEGTSLVSFDPMNTNEYQISYYQDVTKVSVRYNKTLLNWMKECEALEVSGTPCTYILRYTDTTSVKGKTVYTFAVLRNGLKKITDMNLTPTGNAGSLNLSFIFSDAGENLDLDATDDDGTREPSYIMDYIRVVADSNVVVTYDMWYQNLQDLTDASKLSLVKITGENAVVETVSEVDPDYTLRGILDTELVKYLYELNRDINAMIDSCATYEELESLVENLSLMLSTKSGMRPAQVTDPKLLEYVKSKAGVTDDDEAHVINTAISAYLSEVHERVEMAISSTIQETEPDDEGNIPTYDGIEEYVYYASPYTIYYMWLEEYGYAPKK